VSTTVPPFSRIRLATSQQPILYFGRQLVRSPNGEVLRNSGNYRDSKCVEHRFGSSSKAVSNRVNPVHHVGVLAHF
jgi:hypothetical protein